MAKKAANVEKKIKVTLIKSTIACTPYQKKVVEALGLKKIRSFRVHPDNACVRGMIAKISHMLTVEDAE
ncbi:MAG: 50S ribosomal protein L30 [Clostridia bacterium]|nr:50S ribosomal protein L30 [Clostridia bacterium]